MKTIYQKLLMLCFAASMSVAVSAQVDVTASAGSSTSQSYSTLSAAFGAINAGTHQGIITIGISANTTEPANTSDTLYSSSVLSCNYTSVAIYPTVSGVTISGSPSLGRGVVELFGADNVTINGNLNNGSGSGRDLTFLCTTTNTIVCGVIRLITAPTGTFLSTCNNITVKNCVITGNVTGVAGNNSTVTASSSSAWCNYGIMIGGDSSSTSVAATKIARITGAGQSMSSVAGSAPVDCNADNLLFDNNKINQVGRGISFHGNANNSLASSSVTITNNVIGSDVLLSDFTPPVTNAQYATTVYAKGIFVTGSCNALNITGNTLKNICSYLTSGISAIEITSGVGATGAFTVNNNTVTNVYNNNGSSGGVNGLSINPSSTGGTIPVISSNTITNIQSAAAASNAGIQLTSVAGTIVDKNVVKTIYNRNATTGSQAVGIKVLFNGNIITNNRVSDVLFQGGAASFTVSGAGAFGIYASTGTNTKFYHNSVYLSGALFATTATASHITAAFALTSSANCTGNDVRNNIFVNTITGGTTSLAHVAVYLPSGATAAMNLTMNNNAYYCGTTSASQGVAQVGLVAGTTYYTAANFSAGPAAPGATNFRAYTSTLSNALTNDNASFVNNSGTSPFSSDLHTSVSGATQIESGGASISGVSSLATDIDGAARPGGAAPDMGADEFTGTVLDVTPPIISYSALSFDCDATNTSTKSVTGVTITDISGVATGSLSPRIYYKKGINGAYTSSAGTLSSGTWSFTITYTGLGMTNGDSIYYFFVAQDAVGNVGSIANGGVFTDVNTVTTYPASPNFFRAASMSGNYNIGTGFTGQGFTSLNTAIKSYNSSCLTGAVTFSLISASYTINPDTLLANYTASATNTLTIKPTLANTTISALSVTKGAAILLRGADYITINGSIGSTTNSICNGTRASRDLTIKNTFSTSATTAAVIWLGNDATGDPATNNKIINCNVSGTVNVSLQTFTQVGIGCGGAGNTGGELIPTNAVTTNWGIGNINNQYINDSIAICGFGIYTAGASVANKNTGTVISQIITGNTPSNLYRGGISANYEDGIVISGNTINPINIDYLGYPNASFGISLGYGSANLGIQVAQTSGYEVTNATVSKNTINGLYSTNPNTNYPATVGIYFATGSTGTSTISNNTISNFNMGAAFGNSTDLTSSLHILGGAGTVNVYNNTINTAHATSAANSGLTGTEATYGISIANISPIITLKNNIINASFAGYVNRNRAIGLGYNLPATNLTSNNNDLVVTAGTGAKASTNAFAIAQTGGLSWGASGTGRTLHTTLANWQTNAGQDANSLNFVPVFVGTTNLHIDASSSTNCSLKGAGAAGLVSDDIDCGTRASNDIGADEFAPVVAIAATATTVCAGTNVTFTATATNSSATAYQWKKNGGNVGTNSSTYSDAALANGDIITCVITSTGVASCFATATSNSVTMVVNPTVTPTVSISTSSTTVCSGNNITFNASSTNGGSSPSYQWKKNGIDAGTGSSITFLAGTVSTNDNISCVLTSNVSCATSATANSTGSVLTVIASPSIGTSTGGGTMCTLGGLKYVYNSNTVGGGVWSSSNTGIATVSTVSGSSGIITAVSNGPVTITYSKTGTNGCVSTASTTVTVAAVTTPNAITGTNAICKAGTTALSTTSTGGSWSSLNGFANVVNGTVTGLNAGTAVIRYTVTVGSCNAYASYNVAVNAIPNIPSISYAAGTTNPQYGPGGTFCNGKTFTLAGSPAGGSWSATGTAITVGASSGTVNTVATGTSTLTYTITTNGCSNSRSITGTVSNCAFRGVNNGQLTTDNGQWTLYPNPARSVVSLNIETLIGAGSIVVTDLYGKQVKSQSLSMGSNNIDVSNLSKGFYLISTITNEGKSTKKLIVE